MTYCWQRLSHDFERTSEGICPGGGRMQGSWDLTPLERNSQLAGGEGPLGRVPRAVGSHPVSRASGNQERKREVRPAVRAKGHVFGEAVNRKRGRAALGGSWARPWWRETGCGSREGLTVGGLHEPPAEGASPRFLPFRNTSGGNVLAWTPLPSGG